MSDELITAITSLVSAFLLFVVVQVTTVIKRKIKEVREENDLMNIIHEGDEIVVACVLGHEEANKYTRRCRLKLQVMENGDPVWYLDNFSTQIIDAEEEGEHHDSESDSIPG